MIARILTSLALPLAALLPQAATAESPVPLSQVVKAEILPGWQTGSGTHMTGLRLSLAPGWKTYWRAPGDAGIPPHFDWSGSQNLSAAQIHWPRPTVFHLDGVRSIGYQSDVVLPIELTPGDSTAPLSVRGTVSIGICDEICVPMTLNLSADLPRQGAGNAAIRAALDDRPDRSNADVICQIDPIDDGLRLTATIPARGIGKPVEAVIETADPAIWVSEPALRHSNGALVAVADLVPADAAPFALDRSGLRFTLLSGAKAVEIQGCTGG
ncbi:protein-disulfide reductase DsbD domain-containing protein [Actibacterium ureilyticum]|uniref:protein-disulfide reductase DsbD domain-containing protein n=1 Tax=Actibacterium ureilyticum TaxID=1590614 RepID=UPI000BAAC174|nr:protein-disulfide reductase DsbD domain-containing protein [Actibacterium ureilyticum]